MASTVSDLAVLKGRVTDLQLQDESRVFNTEVISALELTNMLEVAEAVAVSASHRKESRGAHTCRDFTARDDQNYLYHTLCTRHGAGPLLDRKQVTLGRWEPEERKY